MEAVRSHGAGEEPRAQAFFVDGSEGGKTSHGLFPMDGDSVCNITVESPEALKFKEYNAICYRFLSITSSVKDSNEGWLSKLLVRRIEPTKESHSRLLSDKEVIYELQTHNVKPDSFDKYIQNW
uniref:Uncharacterized protein n=1 Tax=Timema bartmani TaxID=61472 RepID=A0A7R9HZ75_9NEOP|nr:unnamed protein product [Timema bartmani]